MLGKDTYKNLSIDNLDIYKGAIYESVIGETLIKNNKNLYYFSKNTGLNIDFIIRYKDDICALEVKSNDARAKALKTILTDKTNYNVKRNFKLVNGNVIDD